MTPERVIGVAAVLMAAGIGVGALGSHALRTVLSPDKLASLATAVNYQQINALGLLLIGVMMRNTAIQGLGRVAWTLIAGIIAFSGGIYVMLTGAPRMLGLVTPVGGALLILAWSMLAWFVLKESVIKRQ
jgi:uncharacterized membrane protein YgdD (TMEM256/DUF423 family)